MSGRVGGKAAGRACERVERWVDGWAGDWADERVNWQAERKDEIARAAGKVALKAY